MRNKAERSEKIIIAIDETSIDKIKRIIDTTAPFIKIYKIGSVAFTTFGPKLIDDLISRDKAVFLDLKYFDIPNTVYKVIKQAVSYGVKMLTLHALGGYEMLKRACEANDGNAVLLGVTLLTSMDRAQLAGMGINGGIQEIVNKLASTAMAAGINGLVASGHELPQLRNMFGQKPIIVVPGVRLANNNLSNDDQKRVVTPKRAFNSGADYIVIGRPVTQSGDPAGVIQSIIDTLS